MSVYALLAFVVYPLWLLVGLADMACHRATGIAATSGTRESLLHLLQLGLVGLPILLFLLLDVTAVVLATMALFVLAHAAAAYIDTAYTHPRREISPLEQHVHSFLDMLPLIAFGLVLLSHQPQGDWSWRLRQAPFPLSTFGLVIGAALVFAVAPALLELRTTFHAGRHEPGEPGQ